MKELVKPNQTESEFQKVRAYCETQYADDCGVLRCFCHSCWPNPDNNTTDEPEILF